MVKLAPNMHPWTEEKLIERGWIVKNCKCGGEPELYGKPDFEFWTHEIKCPNCRNMSTVWGVEEVIKKWNETHGEITQTKMGV